MPSEVAERIEKYRRFAPLKADHPLVTKGEVCPGCQEPFAEGDATTLVVVGPGADPEERDKALRGAPHNAVAVPAHWACVTGSD